VKTPRWSRTVVLFSVSILPFTLCISAARANPHPLAFTYPSETLAKEAVELEQYIDVTPVRSIDTSGAETWFPRTVLTTELEIGLTDKLELGLYLQSETESGSSTGDNPLILDGVKQRLRYRLADPGAWPVDVALYLELAELHDELELEGKIILQRRFGRVRAMVNLWGEREFYFTGEREWVLNPTGGVTMELTPSWHVGIESWMHAEYSDSPPPTLVSPRYVDINRAAVVYVGPNLMWQRGRTWVTFAPYVRVDRPDRPSVQYDIYGRYFLRMIVGFE
jgi:hypothetical protein